MGIPAPVISAIPAASQTRTLMEKLFQYRFAEVEELKGTASVTSIAAMTEILGDFKRRCGNRAGSCSSGQNCRRPLESLFFALATMARR